MAAWPHVALVAGILSLMSAPALASPSAKLGAVLMLEDEQGGVRSAFTEELGADLYGRFLEVGPYAQVVTLVGRKDSTKRLTAAIREAAAEHELVDVFLAVHTTERTPAELLAGIPPAARAKLRLVYSTACYGVDNERAAWEALRPQALVTHTGINNPLLALPYFLSRWVRGDAAGPAVTDGYLKTQRLMRFALSLPGIGGLALPVASGSRPMFTGDRNIRITSGSANAVSKIPAELSYNPAKGGAIGLALRALAQRNVKVSGDKMTGLLDGVVLPIALPPNVMDQVLMARVTSPALGKVVLSLREPVSIKQAGVTLMFGETVSLWAGAMDLHQRQLVVNVRGLWVKKGIAKARVNVLTIEPAANGSGYQVSAKIKVFGFVPWTHTVDMGGAVPSPFAGELPVFKPMPKPQGQPGQQGLADAVAGVSLP